MKFFRRYPSWFLYASSWLRGISRKVQLNPVELIQALLGDADLQIQDLAFIFGNEITVSKILTNQQELTLSQIKKLAEFFKISPAVFLG